MSLEFKSVEYQLHESLVQLQDMLSLLEFDDNLLSLVNSSKDALKNKQYNIAVMGEFKRGKSSLINALLGSRILPADATPTTATVNRITYGMEPKTLLRYKDGTMEEISIHDLNDYVTKITPEGEAKAVTIREATIYYPSVLCQNHIDIIDTPGLNDDDRMTRITIDMIKHVDAVVIPIHARAPFSETERNFVYQLLESDGIQNIVFVVTFMDQLDEDDYEYDNFMDYIKNRIKTQVYELLETKQKDKKILDKAHRLLDHVSITGISSMQALQAFVSNNRQLLKQSRFEEFTGELLHAATAGQVEIAFKRAIDTIKFVVSRMEAENDKRILDLERQNEELNTMSDKIENFCQTAEKKLYQRMNDKISELQKKCNDLNYLKELIAKRFIDKLSSITEADNQVIEQVLLITSQQIEQELNEEACRLWREELICALTSTSQELIHELQHDIEENFDNLKSDTAMVQNIERELSEAVNKEAHRIRFQWEQSVVPDTADLLHVNVIETVFQADDKSVSKLIASSKGVLETLQRLYFDKSKYLDEILKKNLLDCLEEKRGEWDLYYKAHIKNFRVLSKDAEEVLKRCQTIWNEFIFKEEGMK